MQRFVRELRLARAAAGGEGYLELEWAPGACQVDFEEGMQSGQLGDGGIL